jgi:hypothetical protein
MVTNYYGTGLALMSRGKRVKAAYHNSIIPGYQGNPCLEALPKLVDRKDAMALLKRSPKYDEAFRQAEKSERYQMIQVGMRFYMPLPDTLKIHEALSLSIRSGYLGRNPLASQFQSNVQSGLNSLNFRPNDDDDDGYSTAAGFSIIGMSGIGKSKAAEASLRICPQVIDHYEFRGRPFTAGPSPRRRSPG